MNKFLIITVCMGLFSCLWAKNDIVYFSLKEALNSPQAKEILDPDIKVSFGSGSKSEIIKKGLVSNKKTNAVGKNDEKACRWALYSAIKSFQQRARKEGGTKVVNLKGFYYKKNYDSKTQFQCGVGNIMVGVTLVGDIAK